MFLLDGLFKLFQLFEILCISLFGLVLLAAGIEMLVFSTGAFLHLLVADSTFIFKQGHVVARKDAIHIFTPEIHGDIDSVLCAEFGGFEENDNEAVQAVDLIVGKIVLGNDDILFPNLGTLPVRQSHDWVVMHRRGR